MSSLEALAFVDENGFAVEHRRLLQHRSSSSSRSSRGSNGSRKHKGRHHHQSSRNNLARSPSPEVSSSRERWHAKLVKRSRDGASAVWSKSRGAMPWSSSASGSSRSLLLRNLARHRNEQMHVDSGEPESEMETRSTSSSRSRSRRKMLSRLRKQTSSTLSVASEISAGGSRARHASSTSTSLSVGAEERAKERDDKRRRRRSFVRGDDWIRDTSRAKLDEKRVSLRGFTSDDGFLTRAEARSYESAAAAAAETASTVTDDSEGSTSTSNSKRSAASISARTLLRCARKGDLRRVLALLDTGLVPIDATLEGSHHMRGKTALIASAERGHASVVISLFGRGADLEARDADGCTALLRAAEHGQAEVALLLLSAGADLEARNTTGASALVLCANGLVPRMRKRAFRARLELLRALFERAKPDSAAARLPQFEPERDGERVAHPRVRELLEEWTVARLLEKDLHEPSRAALFGKEEGGLARFFHSRHAEFDLWTWFKVVLLLCFVVYDVYLQHFGSSWATYGLYAVLYFCAYSI